jgi:hypothetical protein
MKWRKKAIKKYQYEIEAFEEELLILMHYIRGQSARATEIMGIRYQNTCNGGVRNIFIEDGLVCFVTSYYKRYESSEKLKVILTQGVGAFSLKKQEASAPNWPPGGGKAGRAFS